MISGSGLKCVLANIELAKTGIERSKGVKTVVLVTGSREDQKRWRRRLNRTAPFIFNRDNSTFVLSLREQIDDKTGEGNFLGTLLAYSGLKQEARRSKIKYRESVSLMGMLFGRGERMSPFTQIEGDCKPAIASTAANIVIDGERTPISEVEEALMFFAPVAVYLENSGFRGVLNKWGDETQIPSIDLGKPAGENRSFSAYDIIKFISVKEVSRELAVEKDWVVYNEDREVTAQLPRNKMDILVSQLREHGIRPDRDGKYHAGVSLGPVAVSYQVLDIAEQVFREHVRRKGVCLDFDPYVLMAFAMRGDTAGWNAVLEKDQALRALAGPRGAVPDLFDKVNKVRGIFRDRYGRELNLKILDLGEDIFWTDVGRHDAMRKKYSALNGKGAEGVIAARLENIPAARDEKGNIIVNSTVNHDVDVRDSILINSTVTGKGRIRGSVVKDSVFGDVEMTEAFAVQSFRTGKTVLGKNSGIYRSLGSTLDILTLGENMRHGTLLTAAGPIDMTVAESTDLRDKERTYDVPVSGNKMSFRAAYDEMFGVSMEELKKRREQAIEAIKRIDGMNRRSRQ